MQVAALILAAGNSSRMGRSKQLLEYRGASLLALAVRAARDARFSPIIVVTREHGKDVATMRQLLATEPIEWVENPEWECGMGTTIRAGMTMVERAAVDAVMVMVCDQPLITAAHLRMLVKAVGETRKTMAAAAYAGTVGVPALFRRNHFPALAAVPDGGGAKRLLEVDLPARVVVPLPEGAMDVDDEASYRRLLEHPATDL